MLDFIAIGPGKKSGAYYAGYVRPKSTVFVPMVTCSTIEQARSAANELTQEAIARAVATSNQFKREGVAHGFYDDE